MNLIPPVPRTPQFHHFISKHGSYHQRPSEVAVLSQTGGFFTSAFGCPQMTFFSLCLLAAALATHAKVNRTQITQLNGVK